MWGGKMKPIRLFMIFLIFLGVSAAWGILAGSISYRTESSFDRLRSQVAGLWGNPQEQAAPELKVVETITTKDAKGKLRTQERSHTLIPESSNIKVNLDSDARRKGLLWYRTYDVIFDATYTVKHDYKNNPVLKATFNFPDPTAKYADFVFEVNGKETDLARPAAAASQPRPPSPGSESIVANGRVTNALNLPAGQTATIHVHYSSRGMDSWAYTFEQGVTQSKNFKLVAETDFKRYNFSPQSLSADIKESTSNGMRLIWESKNLISGLKIGIEMPEELNPGRVTSRITAFAPIGLLFFLAVVVIIGLMWGKNLHPVHYFFIGGAFFSFHLLMAYTADLMDLKACFLLCAVVSVLLNVSYLVRAIGANFTFKVAAPAQLIFLILFSYAFFFEGYTGLTLTVASILTLAILMHITAKLNWEGKFAGNGQKTPASSS
jgi:inner membrane protein involved in colicin E2 resistance